MPISEMARTLTGRDAGQTGVDFRPDSGVRVGEDRGSFQSHQGDDALDFDRLSLNHLNRSH